MHDGQTKDNEPPASPDDIELARVIGEAVVGDADHAAWTDERFIKWLAEKQVAASSELARAGQRLIVRAYCRKFRVLLFGAPPTTVGVGGSTAPIVPVASLRAGDDLGTGECVHIPDAFALWR